MLECKPIEELIEKLESQNQIPINTIKDLLIFSKEHPEKISKPWPSLLRTQSFFEEVKEYMTSKKGL
jgi:hypothetical protein